MNQLHHKLPYEKYATLPGINFSKLKELARSPLHYQHRLEHPKESTALSLGAAAHTAVLEPHRFLAEYALWDERSESGKVRPRNGKDWEAFKAAHSNQRIVLAEEHITAMAIRDAVRSNADAMRYLRRGEPELSMTWEDVETKSVCKGRVDWLTTLEGMDVLVGLKTARDCRPIGFGNAAARLGYHLQWAMYLDGYATVTGKEARAVEIVVEPFAPHDVVVYRVPAEVIEAGRDEYRRLLVLLRECAEKDSWPGVAAGEQILSLPSWVYHAEDDISDLGLEAAS
jgi:hypothetical protein